jgi:hypothetical protein
MSNITIFKNKNEVSTSIKRESSDFAKSLASTSTTRRIQANINGTFKRIVNGEQIGNAIRGEINLIIINALPDVSRTFYAEKFDPNKEATIPDCWSNNGTTPEAASPNKQHSNCMECPQNIKGSGDQGGKACRYQRRVAVLVEGDASGDIYQFNIPAKSLFGKGQGNVHPFESYRKFLAANGEDIDNVVTNVSFDANADTMQLLFTPVRNTTDDEYIMVRAAQQKPEAKSYTMLTVAQVDKVTTKPAAARSAAPEEPEEEEEVVEEAPQPTKRTAKNKTTAAPATAVELNSVIDEWSKEK